LTGKQKPHKGKGYSGNQPGVKGKNKNFGKVKNKFQERDKGKGNSKWKHSNIDDPSKLSDAVRVFHETISNLPIDDDRIWKREVFKHYRIIDNVNSRKWCMNHCTQHVRDILGREKNKRLYIGPGRDGSSNDKIAVDVKFDSRSTKPIMPENKFLRNQGYVKTSFGYEQDEETLTETWTVIEDQVELDNEKVYKEGFVQMVIILHPMFSIAENDAKKATSSTIVPVQAAKVEAVANLAIDHSPTQEETEKYLVEEEADYEIDKADL